jgi:hypothetical protein
MWWFLLVHVVGCDAAIIAIGGGLAGGKDYHLYKVHCVCGRMDAVPVACPLLNGPGLLLVVGAYKK